MMTMTKTRERTVKYTDGLFGLFCCVLFLGLTAPDGAAMAKRERSPSLLVVPARYTTLQVAFDLLERRNAVLVAYDSGVGRSEPVLHVWDGLDWVPITTDDYTTFGFLKMPPESVVLVGDDATLPGFLIDGAMTANAGNPMQIPHQDTASILNALGKIYDFSVKEWTWFAARYRLDFEDTNALRRQESWYDGAYVDRPGDIAADVDTPLSVDGDSGPLVLSPVPADVTSEDLVDPALADAPPPVTVVERPATEPAPVPVELAPPGPSFDAPVK